MVVADALAIEACVVSALERKENPFYGLSLFSSSDWENDTNQRVSPSFPHGVMSSTVVLMTAEERNNMR